MSEPRKVVFAAQSSAQDDHLVNSGERLVNMYPEVVNEAGRSRIVLRTVPGYGEALLAELPEDPFNLSYPDRYVRKALVVDDVLYVFADNGSSVQSIVYLYSVTSGGVATTITGYSNGYADPDPGVAGGIFAEELNRDLVFLIGVSSGSNSYVVYDPGADSASFENTAAVPYAATMTQLGGYAIFGSRTRFNATEDGRRFEWAALNDPTTQNALNVATKEGKSDPLLRPIASQGRLYLLGVQSTEIWYVTGQANADAFARVSGAVVDIGLFASSLAIDYEETLFFMSDERVIVATRGLDFQTISTQPLNAILASNIPTSMFAYEHRGHKFICVRFSDRPAWCYDLTTGFWHERSTGASDGAWEIYLTVKAYGAWHGVTEGGAIYAFADTNDDDGTAITRKAVSRPLSINGQPFRVPLLSLYAQPNDTDYDVSMRHSKDGGRSWSSGRTYTMTSTNKSGEARFRALGRAKLFQVEVTIDDAVDAPLEAEAVVMVG